MQTGPAPNGTQWDFDAASTSFLVRLEPPHYALVGRGGGGRGVVGTSSAQRHHHETTFNLMLSRSGCGFGGGRLGGFRFQRNKIESDGLVQAPAGAARLHVSTTSLSLSIRAESTLLHQRCLETTRRLAVGETVILLTPPHSH